REFIDRIKEIYGRVKKLESFQQWDFKEVKDFLKSIKSNRYYIPTLEKIIKEDKILARQLEKKTANMDRLLIRALAQAYRLRGIEKIKESDGLSKHSMDYMLNALFDEIRKIISEEREMLKNRRNDLNEELRFLDLQVN
ncbi:MAG: hypothetical protein IIB83_09870, partial [Bacteroidetes bacterium]|nr:hypothetical protein [Bacteroidota bacterium]